MTTNYDETPIDVWVALSDRTEVCGLGQKHIVRVFARKRLGPVVGHREHDNGYERNNTPLRLDRQGRAYHEHVQIDFFNNVSWHRDGDNKVFWPTPLSGGAIVVAVDVWGRLLSGTTPTQKKPLEKQAPGPYYMTIR